MWKANLLIFLVAITASEVCGYRLTDWYHGASLLNAFHFDQRLSNRVYTTYVDRETALREGLVKITPDGKVRIGVDTTEIASGSGRKSVQMYSNKSWNHGLFVMKLTHSPTGCGSWSSWWMVGPSNPLNGEMDIIEGSNNVEVNLMTLHTGSSCDASNNQFTGHWATGPGGAPATNCWWHAPHQFENQGCSIYGGPYGRSLNNMGGGVYALEWTDNFLRVFFFPDNRLPADLMSDHPTPNSWGLPLANLQLSAECRQRNPIRDMNMVINIAFCGDYAGKLFPSQCPSLGNCNTFVQRNPHAFLDTFWLIDYIKVYQ